MQHASALAAETFESRKQFAEALRSLDACVVVEAHQTGDHIIDGRCHMSAGSVRGAVGYFESVQEELDQAKAMLVANRDLAAPELEHDESDAPANVRVCVSRPVSVWGLLCAQLYYHLLRHS